MKETLSPYTACLEIFRHKTRHNELAARQVTAWFLDALYRAGFKVVPLTMADIDEDATT